MAGSCVIPHKVYAEIERECLLHPDRETGGVLVGHRLGPDVVIAFALPAGPRAVKEPGEFSPDHEWQQTLLEFLWRRF